MSYWGQKPWRDVTFDSNDSEIGEAISAHLERPEEERREDLLESNSVVYTRGDIEVDDVIIEDYVADPGGMDIIGIDEGIEEDLLFVGRAVHSTSPRNLYKILTNGLYEPSRTQVVQGVGFVDASTKSEIFGNALIIANFDRDDLAVKVQYTEEFFNNHPEFIRRVTEDPMRISDTFYSSATNEEAMEILVDDASGYGVEREIVPMLPIKPSKIERIVVPCDFDTSDLPDEYQGKIYYYCTTNHRFSEVAMLLEEREVRDDGLTANLGKLNDEQRSIIENIIGRDVSELSDDDDVWVMEEVSNYLLENRYHHSEIAQKAAYTYTREEYWDAPEICGCEQSRKPPVDASEWRDLENDLEQQGEEDYRNVCEISCASSVKGIIDTLDLFLV